VVVECEERCARWWLALSGGGVCVCECVCAGYQRQGNADGRLPGQGSPRGVESGAGSRERRQGNTCARIDTIPIRNFIGRYGFPVSHRPPKGRHASRASGWSHGGLTGTVSGLGRRPARIPSEAAGSEAG